MASYQFSPAQRYAVYVTHGERCYLCTEPVDLKSMQIDHVIPEHLLGDAAKLQSVLESLGLPNSFNLNSFENWMPSCSRCNNRKRGAVFNPSPMIQLELQRASERAPEARRLALKRVSEQEIHRALNVLERASATDELDDETRRELAP